MGSYCVVVRTDTSPHLVVQRGWMVYRPDPTALPIGVDGAAVPVQMHVLPYQPEVRRTDASYSWYLDDSASLLGAIDQPAVLAGTLTDLDGWLAARTGDEEPYIRAAARAEAAGKARAGGADRFEAWLDAPPAAVER